MNLQLASSSYPTDAWSLQDVFLRQLPPDTIVVVLRKLAGDYDDYIVCVT